MRKKIAAFVCAVTLVFGTAGYMPVNVFDNQGGITASAENVPEVTIQIVIQSETVFPEDYSYFDVYLKSDKPLQGLQFTFEAENGEIVEDDGESGFVWDNDALKGISHYYTDKKTAESQKAINNSTATDIKRADANVDGELNVKDVTTLFSHFRSVKPIWEYSGQSGDDPNHVGDINGDNKINITDANILANHISGREPISGIKNVAKPYQSILYDPITKGFDTGEDELHLGTIAVKNNLSYDARKAQEVKLTVKDCVAVYLDDELNLNDADIIVDNDHASAWYYPTYIYDPGVDDTTGDEDQIESGTCGDNLTWVLDDEGTLRISGSGYMYSSQFVNNKDIKNIIIDNGVTSIGFDAFHGCTNLSTITIPDSVTLIGGNAFDSCTSLESITIPDSVTNIGWYAFYRCTNLTNVTLPSSITSIELANFFDCTSLKSVTIPNSVTNISYDAFRDCTSLTSITIPDSVTNISMCAFSGCTSLESITIPDSVTSIGADVFNGCTSLENISIPDSVTRIGSGAFKGTKWLEKKQDEDTFVTINGILIDGTYFEGNIIIPDSVTSIGDNAFYNCTNLTSVTIPNSVTNISDNAFYNCTNLTSVTIPNSVTSIGWRAFSDCSNITSITIPDSVTNISYDAFKGCISLKEITIPKSVTSIGEEAFGYYYCDGKAYLLPDFKIYCYQNTAGEEYAIDNGFDYVLLDAKPISTCTATLSTSAYTYNGTARKPAVTVKNGSTVLKNGTDYTVTYKNNVNVGTATVIITGKGSYTGSKTLNFKINAPTPTALVKGMKVSKINNNSALVTWTKGSGYTDQYVYVSENGCSWTRVAKVSAATNSYTFKNLKAGTSYKFAVKTVNTVSGKDFPAAKYAQVSGVTTLPKVSGAKVASTKYNSATVSWNKVSGAKGYYVYQYDTAAKTWKNVKTVTANSVTISGLKSGTAYKFAVRAYKTVGTTTVKSEGFDTLTGVTTLPEVKGITYKPAQTRTTMSWTKVNGATGYYVYQYNNITKKWSKIKTVSANSVSISGLKAGTSYNFTVRAYKTVGGKTVMSDTYKGQATSTNPANVTFKVASNAKGKAAVSWNKVTGATGYIVYYKTSANGTWQRLTTSTGSSYTKTGLKSGSTYYFTVKAYRTVGGKTYNGSYGSASVRVK